MNKLLINCKQTRPHILQPKPRHTTSPSRTFEYTILLVIHSTRRKKKTGSIDHKNSTTLLAIHPRAISLYIYRLHGGCWLCSSQSRAAARPRLTRAREEASAFTFLFPVLRSLSHSLPLSRLRATHVSLRSRAAYLYRYSYTAQA